MSKQWYFQVMGTRFGPVTSAQLKEKARKGQIDSETLVCLGASGKWQPAARVKGLLDESLPPVGDEPHTTGVPAQTDVADRPFAASGTSPSDNASPDQPADAEGPRYHLSGESHSEAAETAAPESAEYDFFEFVAFDQAIGHALHKVLVEYCRAHGETMTSVTRRALAEFLGRKDLIAGAAPENPSVGVDGNPAADVGASTAEIKG